MAHLRNRMIENMQLYGYSSHTQRVYLSAVKGLARFYQRSPERINPEELRQYFLHLVTQRDVARSTLSVHLCGIKDCEYFDDSQEGKQFFARALAYEHTLEGMIDRERARKNDETR